ncbi:uncharacterized protein LOC141557747 [Sminthopsis crassicaudata]
MSPKALSGSRQPQTSMRRKSPSCFHRPFKKAGLKSLAMRSLSGC